MINNVWFSTHPVPVKVIFQYLNLLKQVSLSPFYRSGNQGSRSLSKLLKVTLLRKGRVDLHKQVWETPKPALTPDPITGQGPLEISICLLFGSVGSWALQGSIATHKMPTAWEWTSWGQWTDLWTLVQCSPWEVEGAVQILDFWTRWGHPRPLYDLDDSVFYSDLMPLHLHSQSLLHPQLCHYPPPKCTLPSHCLLDTQRCLQWWPVSQ